MGAVNDPLLPGDEAMLDVETVVAATWPLRSVVYNLGKRSMNDEDLFSLTFQQFLKAESPPVGVLSVSYGGFEEDVPLAQAFDMCCNAQKLSALGTTIVFSSGDDGVASADPSESCPPFRIAYPR